MAIDAHLNQLSSKHRHLDQQIREEISKPASDPLKIKEMKRQKLAIKDLIEGLRNGQQH